MTEEQKQKARDNYKKYYQKNKERILKYQKTYRKHKLATDPEYKEKYNKRWEQFKESFNEQHPDYHKEYNKQWGKNKRNSYKTRCEKAIEYIRNNCILSNEWTDLDFCNFVPTGNIKYKQLTSKEVKYLLDILRGNND